MGKEVDEVMEGYKETEIGVLPEDWEVVRLEDVLSEIDIRVRDFNENNTESLPVLSLTKNEGLMLQSQRFEKRIAIEDLSAYKVVNYGQIVYNPYVIWEGAVHILWRYSSGIVSPVYPVWETDPEKANAFYIDYLLRMPFIIVAYNRFASGAVNRRRSISKKDFKSIRIPLPPLPEQRKIAHVLSTIQRAIELQDKIIAAARELKKSLMRHLFTYGPVPVDQIDRVPLKETEIGPVPEHWEVIRLAEVADVRGSTTSLAAVQKLRSSKGTDSIVLLYLKVSDFNLPGNELTINISQETTRLTNQDLTRIKTVPPLSIVFPKRGGAIGTNKKRLTKHHCLLDPNLLAVIPIKVNPLYLFYWFQDFDLLTIIDKNPIPQLNKKDVAPIFIPIPPQDEQTEIARMLHIIEQRIATEEKRKSTLQSLFQTMLHLLMTGKVRVKDLEVNVDAPGR